ncbi:MAG: hypothetical protein ACRBCL_10410 [Maritimibacter sp.]
MADGFLGAGFLAAVLFGAAGFRLLAGFFAVVAFVAVFGFAGVLVAIGPALFVIGYTFITVSVYATIVNKSSNCQNPINKSLQQKGRPCLGRPKCSVICAD